MRLATASPLNREDCFEKESNDAVMIVDSGVELTLGLQLYEEYLPFTDDVTRTKTRCYNVTGSMVVMESVTDDGSGSGVYGITVNTVNNVAVRAFATVTLTTGLPELLAPHMKRVRLAYGQMKPASEEDWLDTNKRQVCASVTTTGAPPCLFFAFIRALPAYLRGCRWRNSAAVAGVSLWLSLAYLCGWIVAWAIV